MSYRGESPPWPLARGPDLTWCQMKTYRVSLLLTSVFVILTCSWLIRQHKTMAICQALESTVTSTITIRPSDSAKQTTSWPQFRGPRRDGTSAETGLLRKWPQAGPELLWIATDLGKGYSQAVVADGYVYITGMIKETGYVFAFDLNGKLKWKKPYGREWTKSYPGVRCTPTVDQDSMYVVSGLGELVCMNAETGSVTWRVNVLEKFGGGTGRFGFIESLLINGRQLICTAGAKDAALVAFNKDTGKIIWKTAGLNDKAAYCSPILITRGKRILIVTMTSRHIIGVDAEDGKLLWKYPYQNPYGQHPNTPLYADGMIYCTSGDKVGSLMLRLSSDGTEITRQWHEPALDCHHGNVVNIDGYIYGSAHQNSKGWVCLELNSGKVMFETQAVEKGSACYADGMLYCYGIDGSLSLVKPSPSAFEVISSFKMMYGSGEHFAQPVICNGRLYIRHGDALTVYDIRDKAS